MDKEVFLHWWKKFYAGILTWNVDLHIFFHSYFTQTYERSPLENCSQQNFSVENSNFQTCKILKGSILSLDIFTEIETEKTSSKIYFLVAGRKLYSAVRTSDLNHMIYFYLGKLFHQVKNQLINLHVAALELLTGFF